MSSRPASGDDGPEAGVGPEGRDAAEALREARALAEHHQPLPVQPFCRYSAESVLTCRNRISVVFFFGGGGDQSPVGLDGRGV